MKKCLIVVDMQNDFIDGALGNADCLAVVGRVAERIKAARAAGETLVYTLDTHGADYLQTEEGRHLPTSHCERGSAGWQLCPAVEDALAGSGAVCIEKGAFGAAGLADFLAQNTFDQIELCGVCTDICVISNAILCKAFAPNAAVTVDAALCAGVTPATHQTALDAMRQCQIEIKNA